MLGRIFDDLWVAINGEMEALSRVPPFLFITLCFLLVLFAFTHIYNN